MEYQAEIEWLLEGDSAIRWQTLRDLRDAPAAAWTAEQHKVATTGWGKRLLDKQSPSGLWTDDGPGQYRGLYSPKWTSTTYTLILLRRLGLEARHAAAIKGCDALIDRAQWFDDGSIAPWKSPQTDTCVCAMLLAVFEWFDHPAIERRDGLERFLLSHQKADGGWNCHKDSSVSSVHTTISTLEALQLRRTANPSETLETVMSKGHEYLLKRRLLYRLSTGELMHKRYTMLSFPPRWYYDVLRALEHLATAGVAVDPRASAAIELLLKKRRKDGTWPVQNKHAGDVYFDMEKTGSSSRWNTLRALRVLRWWNQNG